MIEAVNPLDDLRQKAFIRFKNRETAWAEGQRLEKRVQYWTRYKVSIAGLPVQIRQIGLLATLAMWAPPRSVSSQGEKPEHDVLTDLKWALDHDDKTLGDWIDLIYATDHGATLITKQLDYMNAAQVLKQIAGLREASATFEKSVATEQTPLCQRSCPPLYFFSNFQVGGIGQ